MLSLIPPLNISAEKNNSVGLSSANLSGVNQENIHQLSQIHESNNQQTDRFALFNRILQESYQKIAFNNSYEAYNEANTSSLDLSVDLSDYEQVDKISAEQASNTILNFISLNLKLEQSNGASQSQLLERLELGLQSFIKGFNEAKDIIEGLNLLTPQLSSEINDTYERVEEGIEQLKAGILETHSN